MDKALLRLMLCLAIPDIIILSGWLCHRCYSAA
jgi:hypothetical protein